MFVHLKVLLFPLMAPPFRFSPFHFVSFLWSVFFSVYFSVHINFPWMCLISCKDAKLFVHFKWERGTHNMLFPGAHFSLFGCAGVCSIYKQNVQIQHQIFIGAYKNLIWILWRLVCFQNRRTSWWPLNWATVPGSYRSHKKNLTSAIANEKRAVDFLLFLNQLNWISLRFSLPTNEWSF